MPVLLLVLVLALTLTADASSQPLPTNQTHVRFENAVRVPGAMLEPGEYLLTLGVPVGGQVTIDFYDPVKRALVATCLAVESRLTPSLNTMLSYAGTGTTALRAWFHPGNAIGFEFVYSAAEARALYLESGVAVPFISGGRVDRQRIGTYQVAVTGMTDAPSPVGTTGRLPVPAGRITGPEHLAAARRLLANHLAEAGEHAPALLLLITQLDDVEKSRGRERQEHLRLARAGLATLLEGSSSRFTGRPPMARETNAVLEQVTAHLELFAPASGR